jgi:holo-[acyl-carrier protein] synthase
MILGVGTDIVNVDRIRKMYDEFGESFLNKILSSDEKEYCLSHENPCPHIAGRFAVKESVIKAMNACLGERSNWKNVETINWESGKPSIRFSGDALEAFSNIEADLHVSISHTDEYATAFVVIESWE